MKKAFLLLAMIATTTCAFSQPDAPSVAFVAYWSKGDSFDFRVRTAVMEWDDDSLTKNDIKEYFANFRIVDSSATSYTVAWTYPNELLSNWDLSRDMLYELSKYRQSKVVYTTTPLGRYIGIKNWEEQAEIIRTMTDDILNLLAKDPDADFEGKVQMAQSFLAQYGTKEGIEEMVPPELSHIHFPYGTVIPVNDTIRFEEKSDFMVGGNPIRVDVKLWLEDADSEKNRSVLIRESKLNPDDSKASLRELYTELGVKSADIPKAVSESVFSINTLIRYDFLPSPGVPAEINYSKIVRIDLRNERSRREESLTVELL